MLVHHPAVIVHSLSDARRALTAGRPVTLLSAAGAGIHAGALWWKALVDAARTEFPLVDVVDVLDCGDSAGAAMAALRVGIKHLIVWDSASGRAAFTRMAERRRGTVHPLAPPALDLGDPNAYRQLHVWLQLRTATGDSAASLG